MFQYHLTKTESKKHKVCMNWDLIKAWLEQLVSFKWNLHTYLWHLWLLYIPSKYIPRYNMWDMQQMRSVRYSICVASIAMWTLILFHRIQWMTLTYYTESMFPTFNLLSEMHQSSRKPMILLPYISHAKIHMIYAVQYQTFGPTLGNFKCTIHLLCAMLFSNQGRQNKLEINKWARMQSLEAYLA